MAKSVGLFIYLILLSLSYTFNVRGQEPIAKNITLLDHWHADSITIHPSTKVRYNDVWGYFQNGIEYAMIGTTEGVHFFKIESNKLVPIDFVGGKFQSHTVVHRDIKTYKHYAYLVCDEGNSSLQIVDLQYLPDSVHLVYENDIDFVTVHNLFLDEESELMYANVVKSINPNTQLQMTYPMRIYSLANPIAPQLKYTGPNDVNHVHDVYARGNLAILNCGYDGLRVMDVTNPSIPLNRQVLNAYPDMGYNHQGWMTPDGTRYIFGDESKGKRLKLYERNGMQFTHKQTFGTNFKNESVPHNVMCDDSFLYVAYYNEGLRVFDIRSIVKEVAHYNTFNEVDTWYKMNGAWGVYSQLTDGKILVSDRQSGLFLFQFNQKAALYSSVESCNVFPNPLGADKKVQLILPSDAKKFVQAQLIDFNGKVVNEWKSFDWNSYQTLGLTQNTGSYILKVEYINYMNEIEQCESKLIIP